jgi:hypothetical protein
LTSHGNKNNINISIVAFSCSKVYSANLVQFKCCCVSVQATGRPDAVPCVCFILIQSVVNVFHLQDPHPPAHAAVSTPAQQQVLQQQQQMQQLQQQQQQLQQQVADGTALQPQLPLGQTQQWLQAPAPGPLGALLPAQALQQQQLTTPQPQLQPIQQQHIQLQQQQQAILLHQQQQQAALLQQAGLQPGSAWPGYLAPAAATAGLANPNDPFALQQQQQHLAVEPPTQPIAIPQQQQQWLPELAVRVQAGGAMSPSSAASSQLSPRSQLQHTHSSSLLAAAAARADSTTGPAAAQPPELAAQLAQQQQQQQQARLAGSNSPRTFAGSPLKTQQSIRQQLAAAAALDDGPAAASLLLMGASPGSGPRLSGGMLA